MELGGPSPSEETRDFEKIGVPVLQRGKMVTKLAKRKQWENGKTKQNKKFLL